MNEEAIFNVYRRWHPWIKCIFIFGENYKYFAFFYPFFVYYDPCFPSIFTKNASYFDVIKIFLDRHILRTERKLSRCKPIVLLGIRS